ncbi:MAG: ABC transporter ATP-binding protein [Candidatus Hodarchaeales archaeon]
MNNPIIRLENLSFKYRKEKTDALQGINLCVKTGEFIIITGKSGSGKSTLALALTGFIPHTIAGKISGSIKIKGTESKSTHISKISQFVGLVQQDPENQLVCPTVLEEVAFGPENLRLERHSIKKRVNRSILELELEDLALRSTNRLSGGEKQKVAIASILSMKPEVLVFDEPSAFLDPSSLGRLVRILGNLHRDNRTIIIIEHRPELFKSLATRVIVLEEGKIVKDQSNITRDINYELQSIEKYHSLREKGLSNALIEAKNINFHYKKWHILRDLNFEINTGLIYALVGNNGSGKSTLLQVLINLLPYKGTIFFKGKDISKTKVHELSRSIGLIFQNPNHQIFEKSVLDEVFFAPRNFKIFDTEIKERAEHNLKHSNLYQYKDKAPYGLSFGEKRRLNYISVDTYNPELLLLDEPFIGQDYDNVDYLLGQILTRRKNGLTTIIASHRIGLLRKFVDKFILLDKGRIKWQGTRDEFNKNHDFGEK